MDPETIEVTFPPRISLRHLAEKRLQNPAHSKCLNSFFIYRLAFLDEMRIRNFKIKMTEVSPIISASWRRQTPFIKNAYKEFAQEVERLSIELRQNATRRRHVVVPPSSVPTAVMSQSPQLATPITYENYRGFILQHQQLGFSGFPANFPHIPYSFQMISQNNENFFNFNIDPNNNHQF
ncbi:7493_t:CDS:1 [Scutellospora calospora]|uniref:7493_t:CDS:1 n=1 Tax=Scutellospora calospora TaxID=85575 RepID=A0ACA9K6S9_9GLOM|nr:7493_t:CDS:1 [Scutellospora calospora]